MTVSSKKYRIAGFDGDLWHLEFIPSKGEMLVDSLKYVIGDKVIFCKKGGAVEFSNATTRKLGGKSNISPKQLIGL